MNENKYLEQKLRQKVSKLWPLFSDMRIEEGSRPYEYGHFENDYYIRKYLKDCNYCVQPVKEPQGDYIFMGEFNYASNRMTIDPAYVDKDYIILHKMIHQHESFLKGEPRKSVYASLYIELKEYLPIKELLDAKKRWPHDYGDYRGHSDLFFLKSLELDLKLGYPIGHVFGYEMPRFLDTVQERVLDGIFDMDD